MSLWLSIFGGMLLTAAVYWLGRRARLSNFWAAMAAAALPSFAYLAYAFGVRPGLDVVTVHIVVFPTVAVLLGMLNGAKAQWGPSLHWVPKALIAFFVAVVVLLGSFVFVASNGLPPALARWMLPNVGDKNLHTGFAGVVAHHTDAAKGIGQHLGMEHRLAKLGWRVTVSNLDGLPAGRPAAVSVAVSDRDGRAVEDVAVALSLGRPGQAQTVEVGFVCGDAGCLGTVPALDPGAWVATLSLARTGSKPIRLEHTLEVR